MADRKISELTNITGANLADDDEFALVDTSADETKAITFGEFKTALDTATGFVRITGDTMTGNLSMGDNVKAIFGAGSDLQIYHDGFNSYIDDAGAGDLYIRANNLRLANADGSEATINTNNGGSVLLHYAGSQKLITTSTGIDVTGTVTADGLTVDGATVLDVGDEGTLQIGPTTTVADENQTIEMRGSNGSNELQRFQIANRGEDGRVDFKYGRAGATPTKAISIGAGTGDISFYDSAGSSQSFFWDADVERLGIGTTLPSNTLSLEGSGTGLNINSTNDEVKKIAFENSGVLTGYIGSSSASPLRFLNGSATEYMRIDSSGYITSTASNPQISFVDSANSSYKWSIQNTSSAIRFYDNTAASERMRIDNSGRVGIGGVPNTNWRNDTADQEVLMLGTEATLFSDAGVTTELWNNAYVDNSDVFKNISTRGASRYFQYQGAHKWFTAASAAAGSNIGAEINSSPKMILDVSGNLLIGQTDSNARLASTSTTNKQLSLRYTGVASYYTSVDSSGDYIIDKDGAERMRIDSSGNVGIGGTPTNASDHKSLALFGAANTGAGFIEFNDTSGNADGAIFADNGNLFINADYDNATASSTIRFRVDGSSEKMRLDASGNLLVGTTATPSFAGLAVGSTSTGKSISVFSSSNGSNGIIGVYQSNGTQEGQLYAGTGNVNLFGTSVVKVVASTNGVQLTSGATSWTAISDERAKDIIEPITNAVQKVSTLRSVIGKYKTDTEETRRSFLIAQDVQAVLPEAVDATDEDNLGVRYTETIPLLVAAIQEQQVTIQTLTARIAALES